MDSCCYIVAGIVILVILFIVLTVRGKDRLNKSLKGDYVKKPGKFGKFLCDSKYYICALGGAGTSDCLRIYDACIMYGF
jgi:hypothetical protein